MANFSISPGVTISEIDNTFLTGQPVQAGAAIIGPTVKGPVNVPTLVTSYSDYQNYFGDTFTSGGLANSYFTSLAAYNYFNYGGTSLLVTRVVSGSYTSATSSIVGNDIFYVTGEYVDPGYVGDNIFELETISEGVIMNNNITGSAGALLSGTKDNVRFEIITPNTSSGTFTLLVRRGDDRTNQKLILETWNNVSLDPYSPRYISKVIGDQKLVYDPANEQIDVTGEYSNKSRYVRVAAVNNPTPNYLDANGQPKSQYTSSIPVAQNGTFGGAIGDVINGALLYEYITSNNTQGVNPADYDDAINILKNRDAYQFNVLFTPGLTNDLHPSQISTIIQNT